MGKTMIEKIISAHSGKDVKPGDIVEITIDARVARDFGGANVVKNLVENRLEVDDPKRTFFTFDTNPTGSDQKYAANQQTIRRFARAKGITVYDINMGIGTHLGIDLGLVKPGQTFVSTDSHANIMGAIGAFGQGMGDVDIAAAFAHGKVWFKTPKSAKVILKGMPSPEAEPKDVVLAMLRKFGANGLLGYAAEVEGEYVDSLPLHGRITMASMATEMGAIITFYLPNKAILEELGIPDFDISTIAPDEDAHYDEVFEVDIEGLEPLISRPGHPDDVVEVSAVRGTKIDSGFVGSCTNGRYEDMKRIAEVLDGHKLAPGVVLKVVPSTRAVWDRCLREGIIQKLFEAGALVGNPGCAGCAAGQIGQNGPGEITVSTGNRNFPGKQGKGEVYLASPSTVAASAIAGYITTADDIPNEPAVFRPEDYTVEYPEGTAQNDGGEEKPTVFRGRVWYIPVDNIDTDMIYHNRHLAITDIREMGQYAFGNLKGWEDFAKKAKPGDIVVVGKNFGCGSSRQQAVDCFKSLGISIIIAESFGAIYERNAINAGFPIMTYVPQEGAIEDGDELEVDITTGRIRNITKGTELQGEPFSDVQMEIYQRGGLLKKR